MSLQLIIKDIKGDVITKNALNSHHPLVLNVPQQAASYEVHSSDGKPPKKIKATKVNDELHFELQDDVTGEHYDIIVENVSQTEPPVMFASGPDGVVYAYEYDVAGGMFTLTANTVETPVVDNWLIAGGALAGAAAIAGIAFSSGSGSSHHRSSSSQSAANPDNSTGAETGVVTDDNQTSNPVASLPVVTDSAGNPISNGAPTTDNTPTIGGEGMAPGSTVIISDGEKVIGEVTADENGKWTFTPGEALADGEHAIVVDGTDADGNAVSDGVSIIVDADGTEAGSEGGAGSDNGSDTGSEGSAGSDDGSDTGSEGGAGSDNGSDTGSEGSAGSDDGSEGDTGSDTGADEGTTAPVMTDDAGNPIVDGNTTNDNTPTIGGDGMQPGSTVVITDGDTVIGEVTADDDGKWTFTPDAPLADGEHAIVVDGTGADGNAVSGDVSIIVDADGSDTGSEGGTGSDDGSDTGSEGGAGSDDGSDTGSEGGAGSDDGSDTGSEGGAGSDDGSDTGSEGGAGSDDGSDTGSEGGTGSDDGSDTGSEGGAGSDDGSDTGSEGGTGSDDSSDTGSEGGAGSDDGSDTGSEGGAGSDDGSDTGSEGGAGSDDGSDTGSEGGAGSDDGSDTGSEGGAGSDDGSDTGSEGGAGSDDGSDTGADEGTTAPVMTDDAGNPIVDGNTTNDNTPTIGGDGMQPGSTVVITDGDTVIGEVTADDDGKWTFTPDEPLADGEHAIVVDGTSADGNAVSGDVSIIVDADGSDTGSEGGTGSDDGSDTGSEGGTGSDDGSDTGSEGGTGSDDGSDTGSEGGAGSDDGSDTGSEGGAGSDDGSDTGSDTGADEGTTAPVMTDDAGNPIANGSTTNDSTPTIGGDGMQPGSTVVITDGDTVIGEVTADDDGKWSFTPDAPLADGEHAIVVDGTGADEGTTAPVMTDDAGNPIADGSTTNDSTPTFGGDGMQPGSTVTITDGETVIGEVTADDDGKWSFTPDEALADGEHAIVVDGTGADGNAVSDEVSIIVDADGSDTGSEGGTGSDTGADEGTTAPVMTDDAGNPIADGTTTNDSTPTFGGEGMQPGSTVTITDGETVIGEVTADDDGKWTFTPDEALADGEHAIVVDGTDADGNAVSDEVSIIVDAEGGAGSDTGSEGDTGSDTGADEGTTAPVMTDDAGNPIADGSTTNDSTPTFGGDGMQPGSTVTITDGETVIGEVTADDDGKWTFTPDEALADGEHAIVVDGTDADGNAVSDEVSIIVDAEGGAGSDTGSEGVADCGVAMVPEQEARSSLESGKLVQILPDYQPQTFGIWGLYLSREHQSAALRLFLDELKKTIAQVSG
jgi:nucleoid-associated protein YgaU